MTNRLVSQFVFGINLCELRLASFARAFNSAFVWFEVARHTLRTNVPVNPVQLVFVVSQISFM